MAIYSFFFSYLASLADGLSKEDAINQAIADSDWAMEYVDSLDPEWECEYTSLLNALI